jgi:hypothetical protein
MPLVDIVHRICVAKAPCLWTRFCEEQLTLAVDMDTPAPDINLSAMRAIEIEESAAPLTQTRHQH